MTGNHSPQERIVEAARQVFMEKGLEATKMSDIAERAGISRTALNYYYRTKEKLFCEIIEQVLDTLIPKVEQLSSLGGSMDEKAAAMVDIYDKLLRENAHMPKFMLLELQRDPQSIYDFAARSEKIRTYLKALGTLFGGGSLPEKEVLRAQMHLLTVFFGLMFMPHLLEPLLAMYRLPGEMEREVFLDEHKAMVKRLLGAYFECLPGMKIEYDFEQL